MSSPSVQPILALLGYPVGGNPIQYMIEKALAQHELDWRYLTFEVSPEQLGDAVRGLRALGFRGGHCAEPHKQAVLPLLDRVGETAAAVGAVNVFFREENVLVGENTEGRGFLEALRRLTDPAGKRCAILGAGRMGRAIAVELAAAGAAELTIVHRTAPRAEELAELLAGKFGLKVSAAPWEGDYAVPSDCDVLVHATTIGQQDPEARPPVVFDSLRAGLIVADATADPPKTRLLREAAERGCTTLDGLSMFVEQVAAALRLWTGVEPDRSAMRDAVEEFWEV